jgi:AraC family transcriptional regulator
LTKSIVFDDSLQAIRIRGMRFPEKELIKARTTGSAGMHLAVAFVGVVGHPTVVDITRIGDWLLQSSRPKVFMNPAEYTSMKPGLYGHRFVELFALKSFSFLRLNSELENQLALTWIQAPYGLDGPTPRVIPERAYSLTVHLRQPGLVKNWGTWYGGRFRAVHSWDLGGVEVLDLSSDPVVLRESGFESVHIHIPQTTIDAYTSSSGLPAVTNLDWTPGVRDDVVLHWTRMLLPFFGRVNPLPRIAIDELIMMFCAHLVKTYPHSPIREGSVTGGLAIWQQRRAMKLIRDRLDGNVTLADLARECGLSPSHFARAFRGSFGMPAHRYLVVQRIDIAKTLLLHTDKTGLEIALESGFEDQATFSRAFRRVVGTSPSDWKRQRRSAPVSLYWSTPSNQVN